MMGSYHRHVAESAWDRQQAEKRAREARERSERVGRSDDELSDRCPECVQGELVCLGTLGNLTHFRCRACGMDSSRLYPASETTEDVRPDGERIPEVSAPIRAKVSPERVDAFPDRYRRGWPNA